jgi:hypothetical protein
MTRHFIAFLVVLLLASTSLFAVTPTGNVSLSTAPANSDGTCPTSQLTSLPSYQLTSGNYDAENLNGSFNASQGKICMYAHYNGDGNSNPSDATPFVLTVQTPGKQNTSTTITCLPNPDPTGTPFACTGSVTAQ